MSQQKEPFSRGHEPAAFGLATIPESEGTFGKMEETALLRKERIRQGDETFRFSEGTTHQVEGTFRKSKGTMLPD